MDGRTPRDHGCRWRRSADCHRARSERPSAVPLLRPDAARSNPERFAPGVVSTQAIEINGVFAPDFREFVFARRLQEVFTLFRSTLEGGRWSAPQPLRLYPNGAAGVGVDMAISPDGREMFFLGRFKPGVAPLDAPLDIWVSRRRNGAWTTAEIVPAPVSTDAFESYPTVVADGCLYLGDDD